MDHALDLEQLLAGQGYAAATVTEYAKWARRLARWCILHDHDLATLPAHLLRVWIDTTVPASRPSRLQAHQACRHLYTMLGRGDRPWDAIRVPRKPPTSPHPLSDVDRMRLRDAAVMAGGRAGLATLGLLQTGARPSEVAGWRWDGIDDQAQTLRFWRPKNASWHVVPLRPLLAAQLERSRPPGAEGHIFVGDRGAAHVATATVWTWCRQIATLAEVDAVTPRRLRATAATVALSATGDVDAVAELLGHSSVETTRRHYAVTARPRLLAASAALD